MRTFDASVVERVARSLTKRPEAPFDPIAWIAHQPNIALINDNGDVALFEGENRPLVTGHYHFNSRGRQAINAGKSFLDEVFSLNVRVIRGLTPLTNLGARWMSRQLGFTSHGVINTDTGPHELFMLTCEDHK
jgi:hypothetical protein